MSERIAIVTGGASGIGRAIAEALADAGDRVVVADLNEASGKEFADAIGGYFVKVDLSQRGRLQASRGRDTVSLRWGSHSG